MSIISTINGEVWERLANAKFNDTETTELAQKIMALRLKHPSGHHLLKDVARWLVGDSANLAILPQLENETRMALSEKDLAIASHLVQIAEHILSRQQFALTIHAT
jgi:hypothetical protein